MATTLFDIIETLSIESQQIDSVFRNKPRFMMIRYAKEGMKRLNLTFGMNVKGMNVQIPASCTVFKPEGFERFIRAYLIDCDGRKTEIRRDQNMPSEIFNFLVDCDGSLVESCTEDGMLTTNCISCNKPVETCEIDCHCNSCGCDFTLPKSAQQMLHDIIRYKDSWIKENQDNWTFSSDLENMNIIIEYIANQTSNVEECSIIVDEKLAIALEYYIKYRLLEGGQDTMGYSKEYYQKFKRAKESELIRQNALTLTDLYSTILMK